MVTLDEMIERLKSLREEVGRDCPVFVLGWNDCGIVRPGEPRTLLVKRTGFEFDGEVTRVWEESEDGEVVAVLVE